MSSNKNLFYQLYSTSNNVVRSGYECITAIDEEDTSFDITTSATGDSAGAITDSNGNVLSSINLNDIHAAGITQYNSETRLLAPHSCCILQGQEFGLACASYYYVIPKQIKETEGFEYYLNCDFDVIYDNFAPKKLHIHTQADGHTSITKQINEQLKKFNVEVSVSLQEIFDNFDKRTHIYLVYLAQKEGYFYYINNLKVTINYQSEDYPDSPFKKGVSELKTYMIDLIEKYHPIKQEFVDGDYVTPEYDEATYEVDCELYNWLIHNYMDAVNDIKSFEDMIHYIHLAIDAPTEEEALHYLELANIAIQNTVYDVDFFNNYDIDNIEKIYSIIEELKEKIDEINDYYKNFYWLKEDRHMRIPLMKYPNGAFRGIVLIPDWPTKSDDYEYASLWINHIKSFVKLYLPTKEHQYLPKTVGVLSSATLVKEENDFRSQNSEFGTASVDSAINQLTDGWEETQNIVEDDVKDIDTDYMDPYRPDSDIEDDLAWMGYNYYSRKSDIIGLFRYMQYVNDNNLWNKVGEAYMIIGNEDDPQSHNLNLPTSLLVYNPNNEPIRIKYLIFS